MLAAGAGAMGVRLGMPVQDVDGLQPRPELGVGEEADGPFLDTTVGMLWRALVLWVAVLAGMAIVAHGSRVLALRRASWPGRAAAVLAALIVSGISPTTAPPGGWKSPRC